MTLEKGYMTLEKECIYIYTSFVYSLDVPYLILVMLPRGHRQSVVSLRGTPWSATWRIDACALSWAVPAGSLQSVYRNLYRDLYNNLYTFSLNP